MKKLAVGMISLALLVLAAFTLTSQPAKAADDCSTQICGLSASLNATKQLPSKLSVAEPKWLSSLTIVNYTVTTRGNLTTDLDQFKSQIDETLNDSKGWLQAGVWFKRVSSGGSFTIVLAEASTLPSFSSGCTTYYSCRVGSYVIINQDRWLGATDPWNQSGGSLRDYRHMVINHEIGHWLGHDHATCGGQGQLAPVMQQQSSGLYGCLFNPWPLKNELWVSI